MQRFDLDIIGTHLSLQIDTSSSDIGEDFSHIRTRLQAFEERFSRFIEGNWLHSVNQTRSGILDDDGKKMLIFAIELAQKTEGYFDPTVGKRLTELGYGKRLGGTYEVGVPDTITVPVIDGVNDDATISMPVDSSVPHHDSEGDYRHIEIQDDQVLLHGNSELEFGGVGKGYLIDVIRGIILHSKILSLNPRYLINFGGDLSGAGGWSVGLESPFDPEEIIGVITLEDHCLACSAGTKRKWGNHHHLIDPHTGESAHDVVATYIEGSSGIVTDGYATALCVMPWSLACSTLEATPDIEGVLVRYDGTLYQSKGSRAEVFS